MGKLSDALAPVSTDQPTLADKSWYSGPELEGRPQVGKLGGALDAVVRDAWEFYDYTRAASPIKAVNHVINEVYREPIDNFLRGVGRGFGELGVGGLRMVGYNFATELAELSPGMTEEAKLDFIDKVARDIQNLTAYDGNDKVPQFFDKVFYNLGHAVPGALLSIGATMGVAVALPAAAGYVGLAALGRYGLWTLKGMKITTGMVGKTASTFAAGSGVSVVQEYANATFEGREPEPMDAFLLDAGFNLAFGALAHINHALPISNKFKMLTASAIGGGVTAATGADADQVAAMALMFGLIQAGQIRMSSDTKAPGAMSKQFEILMNWVKGKKEQTPNADVSLTAYLEEHKQVTLKNDFFPDDWDRAARDFDSNPTDHISPWDGYIRFFIMKNFDLGDMDGIRPQQLPTLMFNELLANGTLGAKDRAGFIAQYKAELDARLKVNKIWMEEYHKKHGVHYNPDHMNTEPLRYLDGITEPDTPRDLVGKEQINLNDKGALRQKIATLTYTGKDGKTKTKDLKLWELSLKEAIRLFSREPDPSIGELTGDSLVVRAIHRAAVEKRLQSKKKVPLRALYEYKETLGREWDWLYTKDKPVSYLFHKEEGWDEMFRLNMSPEEFRAYSYERAAEQYAASMQLVHEYNKRNAVSTWDTIKSGAREGYEAFVGADGLMSYQWRQKGFHELADSFHMHHGHSSKTEMDWYYLDKETGIDNWDPAYLKDVSIYFRLATLRAHLQRSKTEKGQPFETELSPASIREAGREILLRADSDDVPWTKEELQSDAAAIKRVFDTSLEYAYENNMLTDRQFAQIRGYEWSPLRQIKDVMENVAVVGNDADRLASREILQYLQKGEKPGTFYDIKHLLHSQLARVNSIVAKNRILVEAGRVAEKYPNNASFTNDPTQIVEGGSHTAYQHMVRGKRKTVYIENETAKLLNAGLLQNAAETSGVNLNKVLRAVSMAGMKRHLISSDPSFALGMTLADSAHIIMSHPEFHTEPFGGPATYFDLYKHGIDYVKGNKDKGINSFKSNVIDYIKRPENGVYHQFIKDGGSALSLAMEEFDIGLATQAKATTLDPTSKLSTGKLKKETWAPGKNAKEGYKQWIQLSAAMEMGARLTEYQMLMATGISGEAAAARVTERLNYGRSGTRMRTVKRLLPFLNAGIQSTDSIARMIASNPKAVAKMIPQIMVGYMAVRAWNDAEWNAPGADMDRPLEDRIYSDVIIIPGAKEKLEGDKYTKHFGITIKNGMNPISATAKVLAIAIADYRYQLAHPLEFPEGPVLLEGDKLGAIFAAIRAAAPANIVGFLPPTAELLTIYNMNTKGLLGNKVFNKEGDVANADEIVYSWERGQTTSSPAIAVGRQMQNFGMPPDWTMSSPHRFQAAAKSMLPTNTLIDMAKAPAKLLDPNQRPVGTGDLWSTGWKYADEIVPFFNRHVTSTIPGYTAYVRGEVLTAEKQNRYYKNVVKPIVPFMDEMFRLYQSDFKAASGKNKTPTELLPKTGKVLDRWVNERINQGQWPMDHGEHYKQEATRRLYQFHAMLNNYNILDMQVQQEYSKFKDAPWNNGWEAVGALSSWQAQFTRNDFTFADKGRWLFYKWRDLYENTKEYGKPKFTKSVMDSFGAMVKEIVVKKGTTKHAKDGTMDHFEKLVEEYKSSKSKGKR